MNRRIVGVSVIVLIAGSGLFAAPAQAATVRCVVRDASVLNSHMSKDVTDAGDGDYLVTLSGNKRVQYSLKCTGRNPYGTRQTVYLYRNKREGAHGMGLEYGYANAYRAAKEEALTPAYSKHEFMYVNFNWKSIGRPDGQ